jgi:hypothetical protein
LWADLQQAASRIAVIVGIDQHCQRNLRIWCCYRCPGIQHEVDLRARLDASGAIAAATFAVYSFRAIRLPVPVTRSYGRQPTFGPYYK